MSEGGVFGSVEDFEEDFVYMLCGFCKKLLVNMSFKFFFCFYLFCLKCLEECFFE